LFEGNAWAMNRAKICGLASICRGSLPVDVLPSALRKREGVRRAQLADPAEEFVSGSDFAMCQAVELVVACFNSPRLCGGLKNGLTGGGTRSLDSHDETGRETIAKTVVKSVESCGLTVGRGDDHAASLEDRVDGVAEFPLDGVALAKAVEIFDDKQAE
jgi:hypothetical protein